MSNLEQRGIWQCASFCQQMDKHCSLDEDYDAAVSALSCEHEYGVFPSESVKKAEEIEKLARSLKQEMKQ